MCSAIGDWLVSKGQNANDSDIAALNEKIKNLEQQIVKIVDNSEK